MDLFRAFWDFMIKVFMFAFDYYKGQIMRNENANKMKIDKYSTWFESQLIEKGKFSLAIISDTVIELDMVLASAIAESDQCRMSLTSTSNHSNKTVRVCDQIDLMYTEYQDIRQNPVVQKNAIYPLESMLPDVEFIRDVINKIKSKLKIIDDITQAKKTEHHNKHTKNGNGKNGDNNRKSYEMTPTLKQHLKRLSELIGILETESISRSSLLGYFSEIKQLVHKPYRQLAMSTSSLPSIRKTKIVLEADQSTLVRCISTYEQALKSELLQQIVVYRDELHEIERIATGMFNCMKDALIGPYASLLLDILRHATPRSSCVTPPAPPSELYEMDSPALYRSVSFAESTNDNSHDNNVNSKQIMKQILSNGSSSILKSVAKKNALMNQSTDDDDNSAIVAKVANYARLSAIDLMRTACIKSANGVSLLVFAVSELQAMLTENSTLWSQDVVLAPLIEAMLQFDSELFAAFALDWNERFLLINQTLKADEFNKAYKTLHTARLSVVKAKTQVEKTLHIYSNTTERHHECAAQMEHLKEKFIELALTELQEEVVFL